MSDRPGEGYTYRYSQALKKLLSAKGGEPTPELAPELLAGVILESDRFEFRSLLNVMSWSRNVAIGAVAAVTSIVGVRLLSSPANVLSVVEGILLNNDQAAPHTFSIAIGALSAGAVTGANSKRDGRDVGNPVTTPFTNVSLAAAPASGLMAVRVPANDAKLVPLQAALVAGLEIEVFVEAVNLPVAASFFGYEKAREDTE